MKASLVLCLAVLLGGCASAGGRAGDLPSVAASPAETPSPPATVPPAAVPPATVPPATGAPSSPSVPPTVPPTSAPALAGGGPIVRTSGNLGPCAAATLSLKSDKPSYAPGEPIHLTATLRNAGTTTCTVQASAERGFTVAAGGAVLWRSGCSATAGGHTATEPCPQFITLVPFKPGQSQTRTQTWSQQADNTVRQVAAGRYQITEAWAGLTTTVSVTIT